MNISSIFGSKKQIKSFAEQLAEVKNIFKTSYDQAMALNQLQLKTLKLNKMRLFLSKLKLSLTSKQLRIIVSISLNLKI